MSAPHRSKEFFLDAPTGYHQRGVPVTRLDLSGYGASTFSHWLNPNAAVAAQKRAEAGEDYVIRFAVAVPPGESPPDPSADDSFFELECVKLWWHETA